MSDKANLLDEVVDLDAKLVQVTTERDLWIETAREYANSVALYRGLVVNIGEMFGDVAKTADDGTVLQDVLALKVPGLVEQAMAEIKRLSEIVEKGLEQWFDDKSRIRFGPEGNAFRIEHPAVRAMAMSFAESLGEAPNCVEIEVVPTTESGPLPLIVTIQRKEGKSPVTMLKEAKEEISQLKQQVAAAIRR